MSRLPGEKDAGEILLIDKLMVGGIVFHKHNILISIMLTLTVDTVLWVCIVAA